MAARTIKVVIQMKGQGTVSKGLNDAKIKTEQLRAASLKATLVSKDYARAQKNLGVQTSNLAFVQKRLTASYLTGNIAARAISATVSNLAGAMRFGIDAAIDFEFTMVKISSISGVVGKNLISLEQSIKAIASQSPKTSTEVAQAALEMSKMGLAGKDLENSLEGVVGLSVALDESVESVGRTLVNVKNVFQLDATEITNLANKLFTTLGSSALNLDKFSTAFAFAGSSARLAGVEFDELSGLMGVLADNGIKASTIGTQLRQVFTRLDDSSSSVSKLLGEQSIKTRGLSQTLRILGGVLKDSGDAKKLFGQRAIGVVDILTKNIDKVEELSEKTREMQKDTVSAADALGNTMFGQLKKVTSAFELLFINLGKNKGIFTKIIGAGAVELRRFAESLDGVVQESEFVGDFLNEQIRKGLLTPGDLEGSKRVAREARRAFEELYGVPLERQREFKKGVDDLNSSLKNIAQAGAKGPIETPFNAVTGDVDLIASMKNVSSVQKQMADNTISRINAERKLSDAVKTTTKSTKEAQIIEKERLNQEALASRLIDSESNKAFSGFSNAAAKDIQNTNSLSDAVLEGNEEFIAYLDTLERFRQESSVAFAATELAAKSLASGIDTLGGALAGLAFGDNLKDFASQFKVFAQQIIAQIIAMTVKLLLFKVISTSLGLSTGGLGFAGANIFQSALLSSLGGQAAPKASGFEGRVSQPTLFLAGEEGPENVMVTPRSKTGSGGGSGGNTIVVNVSGDINGEEQFIQRLRKGQEELDRRTV